MEPGQDNPLNTHSAKPGSVPVAPPELDVKPADTRPLPRIFHSIMNLPVEAIARLRALDMTRAMVSVRPRGGAASKAMELAGFIDDFASEVANELGTGGPMLAVIEPNDGVGERFCFGFVAPGEVKATVRESAEVAALKMQVEAQNRRFDELQKLILLGGSGAGSRKEFLEEMAMYKQIFAPPAGQQNTFAEAMKVSSDMFVAMANGFKTMQGAATQIAVKPQEPSIGAQIKEVMDIKGAPELAARIVDRVLPARGAEAVKPMAGPGTERGNPLERVA